MPETDMTPAITSEELSADEEKAVAELSEFLLNTKTLRWTRLESPPGTQSKIEYCQSHSTISRRVNALAVCNPTLNAMEKLTLLPG